MLLCGVALLNIICMYLYSRVLPSEIFFSNFGHQNCKIYGKIFRQTKFQLILLTKDLEVEVLCNDLLSWKFLISEFGRLIFNSSTDVGYRDHWDQVMIFFNQNF